MRWNWATQDKSDSCKGYSSLERLRTTDLKNFHKDTDIWRRKKRHSGTTPLTRTNYYSTFTTWFCTYITSLNQRAIAALAGALRACQLDSRIHLELPLFLFHVTSLSFIRFLNLITWKQFIFRSKLSHLHLIHYYPAPYFWPDHFVCCHFFIVFY